MYRNDRAPVLTRSRSAVPSSQRVGEGVLPRRRNSPISNSMATRQPANCPAAVGSAPVGRVRPAADIRCYDRYVPAGALLAPECGVIDLFEGHDACHGTRPRPECADAFRQPGAWRIYRGDVTVPWRSGRPDRNDLAPGKGSGWNWPKTPRRSRTSCAATRRPRAIRNAVQSITEGNKCIRRRSRCRKNASAVRIWTYRC